MEEFDKIQQLIQSGELCTLDPLQLAKIETILAKSSSSLVAGHYMVQSGMDVKILQLLQTIASDDCSDKTSEDALTFIMLCMIHNRLSLRFLNIHSL